MNLIKKHSERRYSDLFIALGSGIKVEAPLLKGLGKNDRSMCEKNLKGQ